MKYYIGVDLGGTNIAVGLVTEEGELLTSCSRPTRVGRSAEEIAADMAEQAEECLSASGLTLKDAACIGVGVPGAVDSRGGTVRAAVNLNWRDVPLGTMLHERCGLPVRLANDADCAALGEVLAGRAGAFQSALMITLGTGVGGGLIRDRKIFDGWTGEGSEPGHMPLIFGGESCKCGNRGCFETYASATALIRQTRRAMETHPESALWQVTDSSENVTAKTCFDAAARKDPVAMAVVDQYEEYLAAGIAGIVTILRPHVIIIGGGVSNQGENLLAPLREKLKKYCYGAEFIDPPQVVQASLGNDAGMIGAALLGRP